MKIWVVWEIINDYPENGGGEFIDEMFTTEKGAIKYCKKKNKSAIKETIYEVHSYEVKED